MRETSKPDVDSTLQTGFFPEPVTYSWGVNEQISKWTFLHHDAQPLLAGPCFGDGSAKAGLAAWAVVEMSSHELPSVIFRCLSGPLEGRHLCNNGAELSALLYWLLHLDPTYPYHVYYGYALSQA